MQSGFDTFISDTINSYRKSGKPVLLLDTQDSGKAVLAAGAKAWISLRNDRLETWSEGEEKTVRMCTGDDVWEALKSFQKRHQADIYGYFGYDLKNHTEQLSSGNPDFADAPDLWLFVPEKTWTLSKESGVIRDENGNIAEPESSSNPPKIQNFRLWLDEDNEAERVRYIESIITAKKEIYEGDYYEINLSRLVKGRYEGDPLDLYGAMKSYGPVPFGAYISVGELSVCCQSPERFLKRTGSRIISEPIKGTAPVSGDEQKDEATRKALLNSEKNRAENLMIVDLVRHDFSRIARQGSVKVSKLFEIRKYRTLFQMVSTVEGEVKPGTDSTDIIRECFPMGSMTGAPKISAMQAIERLENYRRGIYSGAIGYIKADGDFDLNVVIRTAICKSGNLLYAAGGAITADSDPEEEWEETIVKTRALRGISGAGKLETK